MALDASQSLGAAIALQGTPTDKTDKFYEMGIKADAAKAKAEANRATKDAKEIERLSKMFKIDLNGYLPGKTEKAKVRAAEFVKLMSDKKAQGVEVTSDPEVMTAYNNLTIDLANWKKEKEYYTADILTGTQKPQEFAINPKAKGWLTGEIQEDYQPGDALVNIIDYSKQAKDWATGVRTDKVGRDVGGLNKTTDVFDVEETKKRSDSWINQAFDPVTPNPNSTKFVKEYTAAFAKTPEGQIGTDAEKAEKLKTFLYDEAFKYFQGFQGSSDLEKRDKGVTVNNYQGGPANQGGAVGTKQKSFDLGFQTNTPGYAATDKVTSLEGTVFEGADLSVLIPSSAISVDSGERLSGQKGTKKVTGGEMQIINVFKQGTKAKDGTDLSGTAIPDKYLDIQLKAGVVEPKLMFFGQIDNGKDEPTTGFFAPAESMIKNYDVLTASGKIGKQEIKEQYDRLEAIVNQKRDEYNSKSTKKAQPKAQPTQGGQVQTQAEWNKEWAKKKKGEQMVGLDGKTYTKK